MSKGAQNHNCLNPTKQNCKFVSSLQSMSILRNIVMTVYSTWRLKDHYKTHLKETRAKQHLECRASDLLFKIRVMKLSDFGDDYQGSAGGLRLSGV